MGCISLQKRPPKHTLLLWYNLQGLEDQRSTQVSLYEQTGGPHPLVIKVELRVSFEKKIFFYYFKQGMLYPTIEAKFDVRWRDGNVKENLMNTHPKTSAIGRNLPEIWPVEV